jgi:hypothetical protein
MSISFQDYWAAAKKLKEEDRKGFFTSFSSDEQQQIKRSYRLGGWKDVFLYNQIDDICDIIKSFYGLDLYDIRIKIKIHHEHILVDKKTWDDIQDQFSAYENCFDIDLIFGGVRSKIDTVYPDKYELY